MQLPLVLRLVGTTYDRVSLASSCLTIGEDRRGGSSLDEVCGYLLTAALIDSLLGAHMVEDLVEFEINLGVILRESDTLFVLK